jgi:hypothetical protein
VKLANPGKYRSGDVARTLIATIAIIALITALAPAAFTADDVIQLDGADQPLRAVPDVEAAYEARLFYRQWLAAAGSGRPADADRWYSRLLALPMQEGGEAWNVGAIQAAACVRRGDITEARVRLRQAIAIAPPPQQALLAAQLRRYESTRANGSLPALAQQYRDAALQATAPQRPRYALAAARLSAAAGDLGGANAALALIPADDTSEAGRAASSLKKTLLAAESPGPEAGVPSPLRLSRLMDQILAESDAGDQDADGLVTQAVRQAAAHEDDRVKLARAIERAMEEAQAADAAAAAFDTRAASLDDGTNSGRLAASVARLNAAQERKKAKAARDRAASLREQARSFGYGEAGFTP